MDENMNNIPQNPETAGDQNQNTDGSNQQQEKKGFFAKAHDRWISFKGTSTGKVICFVGRRVRDGAAIYGAYKLIQGASCQKQQEVIAIEAPAQEEQETPVEEPTAEQADEVVNE